MTQRFFTIVIILLLWIAPSCRQKVKAGEAGQTIESFDAFNRRFHSDPAFQISRVRFPLSGGQYGAFESNEWKKDNWEFLSTPVHPPSDSSEYKYSLIKTDTSVREHYWIDSSGFSIEREFRVIGGKWFLVYYQDVDN